MKPKYRNVFLSIGSASLAVSVLQAQTTFSGATTGGNVNTWNTAARWSSGIPTGTIDAVIADGQFAAMNTTGTPAYNGSLTLGTNSTLQIGWTTPLADAYNSLGNGNITMAAGSTLLTRNAGTMNINTLTLTGNATVSGGTSTQNGAIVNFGAISGAHTLTVNTHLSGNNGLTNFNNSNGFSALVLTATNPNAVINAKVAGSLGAGNVTMGAGTLLTFGTAAGNLDVMADTGVLRIDGNAIPTRLTMTASDTIGRLYVSGVKQIQGAYTSAGRGSAFMSGAGTLTVNGPTAAYWDLNGSTAGAGGGSPAGTWNGSNTFWNASDDGTGATSAWVAGSTAFFSAGGDATGIYGITVSGTQDIGGLGFEEGNVSLSGGGLRMTEDLPVFVASGASASIGTVISEATAGLSLNKSGDGKLTITANNTYTGATAIGGGVLSISSVENSNTASQLGQFATAGAGGLTLGGGTLQYTGGTSSTDRGFTLSDNSTIDVATAGTTLTLGASTVGFGTNTNPGVNPGTLTVTGGTGSSLSLGAVSLNGAVTFNPTTGSLSVASVSSGTATNPSTTLGGASTGNVIGAIATGNGTLTKTGISTWTLSGTNAAAGTNTANGGGTLILDFGTTDTTKLANGGTFVLGGGTLGGSTIQLKGATGSHIEIVSATTLSAGGSSITRDGANTAKLRMNAITRQAGGTISFADGTVADTDNLNIAGILGGYATVGNDWAMNSTNGADGAIVALTSYTAFETAVGSTTTNYSLTGASTLTGALSARTLKITDNGPGQSLALGSNDLTIASTNATTLGGIMYAGGSNDLYSITGSTGRIVTSTANQELIFAVQAGTLSVGAFVGASTGSSSVTKSGAGTMEISSNNAYTGAVRVNEGVLRLANANATGTNGGGIVVQNKAALELTGGLTFVADALTITGTGVSNGGALRNVSGDNNYTGAITIGNGGARINADSTTTLGIRSVVTAKDADVTFGGTGNVTQSNTAISGAGGLFKDGAGTLTLSLANTYSGGTTVSAGTLALSGSGTLGNAASAVTVSGGVLDLGTLTRNRSGNVTLSGGAINNGTLTKDGGSFDAQSGSASATLDGTAGLNKTTVGTVTLTGANTYTGATSVGGGILLINGSTSSTSLFTVNDTATLGGTGSIGGGVTVKSGGTLSPGASIESLASGALTMEAGSTFAYEVLDSSATGADLLGVNGALSLTDVSLDLSLANAALAAGGWIVGDKITLISYLGDDVISGFIGFEDDTDYTYGANIWTFNYNDTVAGGNYGGDAIAADQNRFVTMTVTAIPEPSSAVLFGALGMLALLRRRR